MDVHDITIDCTGDVEAGDVIRFTDVIWGGSRTRPVRTGERLIVARVLGQSIAGVRRHHVFTLEVLHSSGVSPIETGKTIVRKSRNVYRNGAFRAVRDQEKRAASTAERLSHVEGARAGLRSVSARIA